MKPRLRPSVIRPPTAWPTPEVLVPPPFTFTLDGNPVTKGRPRVLKNGHVHTPKATQEAERDIELVARAFGARPHHGPVALVLRFWHDGTRARDWDNLAKTVCDALNGVCWLDDSQITRAVVEVAVDAENPRTEVEVRSAHRLLRVHEHDDGGEF